jgi:hypothetical protein
LQRSMVAGKASLRVPFVTKVRMTQLGGQFRVKFFCHAVEIVDEVVPIGQCSQTE